MLDALVQTEHHVAVVPLILIFAAALHVAKAALNGHVLAFVRMLGNFRLVVHLLAAGIQRACDDEFGADLEV